ncbi:hypothetical protein [Photorhabdus antumapuensis]|uniref:hypothetical protein n=1 Tax=Photorhabdus antumapuensis TaxID=2862867 RepID=UPI001CEC7253|nr:hypothetical protein [Photorhabdus antumapuensis]MCA6221175.1 hypothetical protein [Photorhabdus antumapuensis]
MSDKNLDKSKVLSVEFNNKLKPRVVVSVLTVKDRIEKYGIYWEDSDDEKSTDHSLVIYNILLAAMSNQNLRISGTFEGVSDIKLTGMIKTLIIEPMQ